MDANTNDSPIPAWPVAERPREKLVAAGPATLTDAELVAVLLRSGAPGRSALAMARARMETNQPDLAIGLYQFVVDNGYPKAMKVVGRERLARVLLDQGQPEKAMETLNGADDISGYEARYAEVRGDILFSQGRTEEAIAAYQESLDALEAGVGDRAKLVMKLESMGATVPEEAGES